jgi:hypothetical protein
MGRWIERMREDRSLKIAWSGEANGRGVTGKSGNARKKISMSMQALICTDS